MIRDTGTREGQVGSAFPETPQAPQCSSVHTNIPLLLVNQAGLSEVSVITMAAPTTEVPRGPDLLYVVSAGIGLPTLHAGRTLIMKDVK